MSNYADGYRAGLEAAAKVADGIASELESKLGNWAARPLMSAAAAIRALPVPATPAQPEVERLREALRALYDGCVSLDPEQAVLPQQMQAARIALGLQSSLGPQP